MLKILILLKKWPGGVGVVVRTLKEELEKKGHRVDVVSREEDLKINSFLKSIFVIRKEVKNLMKEKNYDIIYTQDWNMAFPLIYPTKLFYNKHFCCFHGIQPGKIKILQNLIAKKLGNKLIVVGDSLKRNFPKSNLIYNCVDMEKFKPNDKINRIKNSVGFVNWKTDDYHYDEIKRVCKELGKKLIVAEGIPYNQMPEFYNKLETFISLPPSCTGFNNSWVEAMACDVPKIIGNKYGIGHELPIYYVDENMSLSEAIMLAKKRKYRDWVKNVYNIKKQIDKILGVFKDERG